MTANARRDFLKNAAFSVSGLAGAGILAQTAQAQEHVALNPKGKIIGLNTSHRAGKTCFESLKVVLESVRTTVPSLETEILEFADMKIGFNVLGGETPKDDLDDVIAKITNPNCLGIVVASPVYFGLPSARCVAWIDRLSPVRKEWKLRNKVLGLVAVAAGRNGGQETVLHALTNSLISLQMVVAVDGPPTSHWGATLWNQKDSIAEDEFGKETAKNLGKRIAELARMLNDGSVSDIP